MKKLTDEEKEKLVESYVWILPSIKDRMSFKRNFFLIVSSIVLIGVVFAGIFKNSVLAIVFAILEAFPFFIDLISRSSINDDIRNILNGKMSVREFKLLLKSGMIDELINKKIAEKNIEIKLQNEYIKDKNKKTNIFDKEPLITELKPIKPREKKNLIQRTSKRILEKKESEVDLIK